MSTPTELAPARPSALGAFAAILWRDVFVTGKEIWVFLAQTALQPLFMLFVFAKVLNAGGYVSEEYSLLLLPGIVALTAFLTALQTVALPMVMEFSFTKEIEDRLLAPLPTWAVAVEKLTIAVARAMVSVVIMFPIGFLVLGAVPWHPPGVPLMVVALLLGSWVGAAIGLTLGTVVQPSRISIMFALILTPLMFTGATQYPWKSLDSMAWFQVVTLFNPLTYLSEAVRAASVPDVPHIAPWISLVALAGFGAAFTVTGLIGFRRRAVT
ncbi:ABC transporter permease [Catenuloplanes atrovinosus]|uniref:Transport permease protein n=1 Tax=Catenuloplanes atrovinosus TaxID=137266 RepID=A0AAE4CGJ4_9ACTN|nr:ABC transporter permease [Catenuloplanes atrovinosus]MDR7280755.1 ABC-2 type transport system permease protein [Catenuloplanes atrovinosus]